MLASKWRLQYLPCIFGNNFLEANRTRFWAHKFLFLLPKHLAAFGRLNSVARLAEEEVHHGAPPILCTVGVITPQTEYAFLSDHFVKKNIVIKNKTTFQSLPPRRLPHVSHFSSILSLGLYLRPFSVPFFTARENLKNSQRLKWELKGEVTHLQ